MIRSLAAEGSPVGDMIRENNTLAGFICMGLVVLLILGLVFRKKK
jgi:hypothetical protein